MSRGGRWPAWTWAFLLGGLLLCHRLLLLHFAFDDLFTPGYELFPMGVLGHEILRGLDALPFLEFHDTHSGGQMLSSALTALSFRLFGATYLALKLVPVFFALVTLVGVFLLADRRFGRETALFVSFLLLLGPASYTDYSTSNYGNHSEVLAFVVPLLGWAWAYLTGPRRGAAGGFLLGLLSGLAVWYALSSLLVVALIGAFWWLSDRVFFLRRSFAAFLAGAALGASPLFVVAALYEAPQVEWMEAKFAGRGVDLARAPARFVELFAVHLPRSAATHDLGSIPGWWIDRAWFVLWAVAFAFVAAQRLDTLRWAAGALLPGRRRAARAEDFALVLLLYPFALAGAYAFSNFKIGNWKDPAWGGYRYLFTLFLVLLFLVATAHARLLAHAGRIPARLLAAAALAFALLGALSHPYERQDAGKGRLYDGYYYPQTGRIFAKRHWAEHPERVVETIDRLPPRLARDAWRGVGIYTALRGLVFEPDFRFEPFLRRYPDRVRPFLAQGLGAQAARHLQNPQPQHLRGRLTVEEARRRGLDLVLAARGLDSPWLVQGLFLPTELLGSGALRAKMAQNQLLLRQVPPKMQRFARQGLGMFAGEVLLRGIPSEAAWLERAVLRPYADDVADQALRSAFLVGVGYAADRYLERTERCDRILAGRFRGGDRRDVYAGVGWVLRQVLGVGAEEVSRLPAWRDADARAGLREGLEWRRHPARFVPVRRAEDPR